MTTLPPPPPPISTPPRTPPASPPNSSNSSSSGHQKKKKSRGKDRAPSPRPPAVSHSQRGRSAPVAGSTASTTSSFPFSSKSRYFPRNRSRSKSPDRSRSRTPSPASDSELDGALLRGWATIATEAAAGEGSLNFAANKPRRTSLKKPAPNKKGKSRLMRTFSGGSATTDNNNSDNKFSADSSSLQSDSYPFQMRNNMSSLFHVTFPTKDTELRQIQEFEKIDSALKPELWYFAKELKYLLAIEVERNRQYEEGELGDAAPPSSIYEEEEICCWRGLEHVFDADDRSIRIRTTVAGIVNWYHGAKEMGYEDPDELRVVSKSRTKNDRTKAQKKGQIDAQYMKKLLKGDPGTMMGGSSHHAKSSSSSSVSKKMARRISKTFAPKLNWSPKPNKKQVSVAAAS